MDDLNAVLNAASALSLETDANTANTLNASMQLSNETRHEVSSNLQRILVIAAERRYRSQQITDLLAPRLAAFGPVGQISEGARNILLQRGFQLPTVHAQSNIEEIIDLPAQPDTEELNDAESDDEQLQVVITGVTWRLHVLTNEVRSPHQQECHGYRDGERCGRAVSSANNPLLCDECRGNTGNLSGNGNGRQAVKTMCFQCRQQKGIWIRQPCSSGHIVCLGCTRANFSRGLICPLCNLRPPATRQHADNLEAWKSTLDTVVGD